MSEGMCKIAFEFNNPENIFHKIRIGKTDYDLKDEGGIKYFEIPKSALNKNGELKFDTINVTKKNVKNEETDEEKKESKEFVKKEQQVKLDQSKNFFLINVSLGKGYQAIYNANHFESLDEFNQAVKNSYTTFVIVANKDYDINHYQMLIDNVEGNDVTLTTNNYGTSAFDFTFDKETDKYKFAVIKFPINLNNKQLYLYSNDPSAGKTSNTLYRDQQHLLISPDKQISNDTEKSVQIVLEEERHVNLVYSAKSGELKYLPLTEEFANLAEINTEPVTSHETKEINNSQIKEEDKTDQNNNNTTENNEILLNIVNLAKPKYVNALLLNGEIHFLDNQNDKIYLEKDKEYKIEPVYYDDKKEKFYYFPKSNVYKFNSFHIYSSNSGPLIIDNNFDMYFENDNYILNKNSINHEKSSNLELGFGGVAGAGAIGSGIAIVFGFNPIVAIIIIAVLATTCLGLFIHGGTKKSKIYTPPKEDKSQKPETENFDEVTSDIKDPILAQNSQTNKQTPTVSALNDPIWSYNPDNENGQPPIDDDDSFRNNPEEEDLGEPI